MSDSKSEPDSEISRTIPRWAVKTGGVQDNGTPAIPIGSILVSNGREVHCVHATELDSARQDGFYEPLKFGRTLVSDGHHVYEIPLSDLSQAASSGMHAILDAQETAGSLSSVGQQIAQRQAEQLDAETALDEAIETEQGLRRFKLLLQRWYEQHRQNLGSQSKATTVSFAVHVALLLILASLFIAQPQEKGVVILASSSDQPEDFVEEIVIETEPIDVSEIEEEVTDVEMTEVVEVAAEAPIAEVADFAEAIRGDAVAPPVTAVSLKSGPPTPKPKGKPSKFFGAQKAATNYVFVIDNSLSMSRGRFETALIELDKAVSILTPKQRFYVAFYSDQAYGMMHPQTVTTLVPATDQNKIRLRRWLNTVELCLKTNGKDAIARAFALRPDVIFVLGDGAFTDKADLFFTSRPQNMIPLHTRGMEVNQREAASFAAMAKANAGTYKNVQVSPEGLAMSKKYPRNRNRIRSQFWGLNLPLQDKKKQ